MVLTIRNTPKSLSCSLNVSGFEFDMPALGQINCAKIAFRISQST